MKESLNAADTKQPGDMPESLYQRYRRFQITFLRAVLSISDSSVEKRLARKTFRIETEQKFYRLHALKPLQTQQALEAQ